tara:strand:- start:24 stop:386 length:363 start_codon:yes stop_codon:yes gene_type:complete
MNPSAPPTFGPNGAVLNSDTMTDGLRDGYLGRAAPRSEGVPQSWGWRLFGALFALANVWVLAALGSFPVWIAGAVSIYAAARVIRDFWPMGARERLAWFVPVLVLVATLFAYWIGGTGPV